MQKYKQLKLFPVILALLFAITDSALAWNGTGHMLVAELAWRKLSTRERRAVSDLLKQHPHYRELLSADVPQNIDRDEWVFLRAATWPDLVRPGRLNGVPKPDYITSFHRSDWHYVNLPFVAPGDSAAIDVRSHPPKPTNIIERLSVIETRLRFKRVAASEKAVALCWYLHLMGDMHQPLHCSAWFSPEFPQGDMGGNLIAIKPQCVPVKLHAFWDDLLGTGEGGNFIALVSDMIDKNPLLQKDKLQELKAHKTYTEWAKESADLAEAFAYLDGRLRHGRWQENLAPAEVPDVNFSYENNAYTVAQRRVALAGIRLKQKLKRIY